MRTKKGSLSSSRCYFLSGFRRNGDCVKINTSGFVIPTKVGRRLDSARIQFMFEGYGSPLSRG
jgi:hypothetical protein